MKYPFFIFLSLIQITAFGQNDYIINKVLTSRIQNTVITTVEKDHATDIYVLNKTAKWPECKNPSKENSQFELDENGNRSFSYGYKNLLASLGEVGKKIKQEELIICQQSGNFNSRPIKLNNEKVVLVNSIQDFPGGIYYSITDPVVLRDNKHALILLSVYKKDEESVEQTQEQLLAEVTLAFKKSIGKKWKKVGEKGQMYL